MEQKDKKTPGKKEDAGLFWSIAEIVLYALTLLRKIIKALLNF